MSKIITATEATRQFSDLLNKVYYQHQSFDIKRGKEVIARIVPVAPAVMPIKDLNAFFKNLPALDKEDQKDFENLIKELRNIKPEKDVWD